MPRANQLPVGAAPLRTGIRVNERTMYNLPTYRYRLLPRAPSFFAMASSMVSGRIPSGEQGFVDELGLGMTT